MATKNRYDALPVGTRGISGVEWRHVTDHPTIHLTHTPDFGFTQYSIAIGENAMYNLCSKAH